MLYILCMVIFIKASFIFVVSIDFVVSFMCMAHVLKIWSVSLAKEKCLHPLAQAASKLEVES